MGIGLGGLVKLAKSGLGPDELAGLLEAMGMNVEFAPLERNQYRDAFSAAGAAASLPHSRVVSIRGTDKEGAKIEALLIMAPCQVKT